MKPRRCLLVVLMLGISAGTLPGGAQEQKEPPAAEPAAAAAAPRQQEAEPKPYDKVITKEAKTKKGVFTVHWVKNKVYYEIPTSELGKDYLWVSQIAKTTLGAGEGG